MQWKEEEAGEEEEEEVERTGGGGVGKEEADEDGKYVQECFPVGIEAVENAKGRKMKRGGNEEEKEEEEEEEKEEQLVNDERGFAKIGKSGISWKLEVAIGSI